MKRLRLKEHKDKRGALVENTLPEIFLKAKHFFVSTSKPGAVRGNHYHTRKYEWFSVIQGKAKVYLYDLKSKKRTVHTVSDQRPELVTIEKNVAHAIQNIGKEPMVLLAFMSEKFNSKDPDIFAYDMGIS